MAFTNYIQQITATNGTTHDLVDTSASHYVKGTQTSSTNAWTGALPDGVSAYYDGLAIDYFLPYAGTSSGATLNLGSKGAKPVYIGNSTTQATTHYPQYSVIHLTYIINSGLNSGNGCWKASGYYDTNTTYTIPTKTSSNATGITASTTATKTTLGTAFSIPNVTGVGSASTWAFEDVACDDITSWSAGSGSASISGAVNSSDSTQLDITISHTHTAPSLSYSAKTASHVKSGGNGSAPTLGTAFSVPNVTGNTTGSVTITDPKHSHTLTT